MHQPRGTPGHAVEKQGAEQPRGWPPYEAGQGGRVFRLKMPVDWGWQFDSGGWGGSWKQGMRWARNRGETLHSKYLWVTEIIRERGSRLLCRGPLLPFPVQPFRSGDGPTFPFFV